MHSTLFTIPSIGTFDTKEILFVFALESEAGNLFDDYNTCFTGIGKMRATYFLNEAIQIHQPKLIINLGTAGSHLFQKGSFINCTKFLQRDMNLIDLGFKPYETPFSDDETILTNGIEYSDLPKATCGSGDQFESNLDSLDYQVVDMEAFALAWVSKRKNIPFLCIKYISDGANDNASEDWTKEIINVPMKFKSLMNL